MDLATHMAAVPVEDADHPVGRTRLGHGAQEQLGAVTRADQQHRDPCVPIAGHDLGQAAVLEDPIQDARPAQERQQHEPVDEEERARQVLKARDQEHERQEDE